MTTDLNIFELRDELEEVIAPFTRESDKIRIKLDICYSDEGHLYINSTSKIIFKFSAWVGSDFILGKSWGYDNFDEVKIELLNHFKNKK